MWTKRLNLVMLTNPETIDRDFNTASIRTSATCTIDIPPFVERLKDVSPRASENALSSGRYLW